jgi:hypothetical protein
MEYSDTYLRQQLPREDPPFELIPADVSDEIASWIERIDVEDRELIARSTRWTYAIFAELASGRFEFERPWYDYPWLVPDLLFDLRRVSIGLFDKEFEGLGFGIVIDVPRRPGSAFEVIDTVVFPRLRQRFPLGFRRSEIELHLAHPANATSACWARCNSTGLWGVLTAGHAVPSSRPGRAVSLAGGGYGNLLRSHYQPVDAAFVLVQSPPRDPTPLPLLSFPAAGQPVTIECQSGSQHRTIFRTMDTMGVNHTREFAVLFYLDRPGVPGDSGSLVRMATGEAAGLYKGSMQTIHGTGGACGLVQNFEQAIFALDVTPYL